MRQTIKGVIIGAVVAAGLSVLLAQSPTWTTPRTWATDDLLTATQFNAQFRDNLLWLRQDAQLTGTDALLDLGCGTLGTNEVLFSDCTWATIPAGVVFDIHDDVGTAATIVDSDRIPFSDESANGDPMRFTTAANFANYMQTEVELSANRITSDTLNAARLPGVVSDLGGVSTPSPSDTQKYNIQVTSAGVVSLVESPFELFVRRYTGLEFMVESGTITLDGQTSWELPAPGIYIVMSASRGVNSQLPNISATVTGDAVAHLQPAGDNSFVPVGGTYDNQRIDAALVAVISGTGSISINTPNTRINQIEIWLYIKRLMDIPTI